MRKRLGLLLTPGGRPIGGRWTFDTLNREPLPKGIQVPPIWRPPPRSSVAEAIPCVKERFPDARGDPEGFFYPVTHADAELWLENFLINRLPFFGTYEDSIPETRRSSSIRSSRHSFTLAS